MDAKIVSAHRRLAAVAYRAWLAKKIEIRPAEETQERRARAEDSAENSAVSAKPPAADGMSETTNAIRFFQEMFKAFANDERNLKRPRDGRRSGKKMNMFFRRAFDEYARHKDLKKTFAAETGQLNSILKTNGGAPIDRADFEGRSPLLLLLLPLVEIAWADGRVTRREMDAIVQVAEVYGLIDDADNYGELMQRMMLSRPIPNEVGRMWQDFRYFMESLSRRERETVIFALLAQAQFVAEQSTDGIAGFLSGERICRNEQEALRLVAEQLERAKKAAEATDVQKYVAARIEKEEFYETTGAFFADGDAFGKAQEQPPPRIYANDKLVPSEKAENAIDATERRKTLDAHAAVEMKMFPARGRKFFGARDGGDIAAPGSAETKPLARADDSDQLIPLIPLVKVAWAEGRITRRERELIFETAARKGIEAGSPSHDRLASWLELHPTDDFYLESLERISDGWRDLPEEEKNLRRLDLLSDCVNVAEASGGTTRYAAGGRRICDEEFAAVKRIAHKLNAPPTASPAALISLAA